MYPRNFNGGPPENINTLIKERENELKILKTHQKEKKTNEMQERESVFEEVIISRVRQLQNVIIRMKKTDIRERLKT